jgi:GNAT superfamily N-acetyltransferase
VVEVGFLQRQGLGDHKEWIMGPKALELAFEVFTEADIPELTAVMTRAFDDDAQKHLGVERGGPPGYDNGGFFREWLFGYEESVGYKIVAEGKAIGGIIVWILPNGDNALGTIFVDPAYQDRGVGTRAWQFIEATYPEARSWRLGTPAFAEKNHHFYEAKCGFTKVGEEDVEGYEWKSCIYKKEMLP